MNLNISTASQGRPRAQVWLANTTQTPCFFFVGSLLILFWCLSSWFICFDFNLLWLFVTLLREEREREREHDLRCVGRWERSRRTWGRRRMECMKNFNKNYCYYYPQNFIPHFIVKCPSMWNENFKLQELYFLEIILSLPCRTLCIICLNKA